MSGFGDDDDPFGYKAEEAERDQWTGNYDGTSCDNCKRERVILCTNEHRVCEKCRWDHNTGAYCVGPSDCP